MSYYIGTPPQRKTALRQIADKAREFGAECLFNQILPLLMSPTLEDQERHLLVKVIDRILYKLGTTPECPFYCTLPFCRTFGSLDSFFPILFYSLYFSSTLLSLIPFPIFKGDLVRPYVHKVLSVIEPLLIDEDYYARVEGREIISNLSKAAGVATMIATMRPDIDNPDEYVRNTTARAFAVVASALRSL